MARPKNTERTETLWFRLTPDEKQRLKELARAERRDMTSMVRELIHRATHDGAS